MSEAHTREIEQERARLANTLVVVQRQLDLLLANEEKLEAEISFLLKHYTHDSVDMFDQLVVGHDLQRSAKTRIKNHMRALGKPYFARIDFADDETPRKAYYIGKHAVMNDATLEPDVIDWRAPVSTLYYEGVLGPCSYEAPEERTYTVELSLKRQFDITDAQLLSYYDVDLVANDELLQKVLNTPGAARLKEVVSTIQGEQNHIIRRTPWRHMVVQGVAGSGKTTVALHRIAYVVFNYEDRLPPERFLIIGPNKFFLNYISNVLPDLGVEAVKQVTYEEVYNYLTEDEQRIAPSLALADDVSNSIHTQALKQAISFKGSMAMKPLLDAVLAQAEWDVVKKDIVVDGVMIFTMAEQRAILAEFPHLPLAWRCLEINKYITKKVQQSTDAILSNVMQSLVDQAYGEDRDIELDKRCAIHMRNAVKTSLYKPYTGNAQRMYWALLKSSGFQQTAEAQASPEAFKAITQRALQCRRDKSLDKSDIASVLYLHHGLQGFPEASALKQIIIDEAQDVSPFAVFVLKTIAKNAFFTLLGDVCQGIFDWEGITDWQATQDVLGDSDFFTLDKSYRSTMEIMAQANKVLTRIGDGRYRAECVERHGQAVAQLRCKQSELPDMIVSAVTAAQQRGMNTVAIVGRTAAQCAALYTALQQQLPSITLITGADTDYHGGVSVLPVYLAKGMEFDTVILADVDALERDLKMMYVALTRALSELVMVRVE